jgi:hypothetical protein
MNANGSMDITPVNGFNRPVSQLDPFPFKNQRELPGEPEPESGAFLPDFPWGCRERERPCRQERAILR